MEKLNASYLTKLAEQAKAGDSNAFAELFVALSERHFHYLSYMLDDEEQIKEAMKDIYVQILHHLSSLHQPALYIPWSMRICYRYCREQKALKEKVANTPAGPLSVTQILNLPLTESQLILMRYEQGLSVKEIGEILNIDSGIVKRGLKAGVRHLQKGLRKGSLQEASEVVTEVAVKKVKTDGKPDAAFRQEVLEEVFDRAGQTPNTIPMEALSDYVVYRKERFSLQRGILIAALVVFLLLPTLFILPKYEVTSEAEGIRGLPVYEIKVSSLLPVHRVLATVNKRSLPVYEAGAKAFSVEPTRNGTLEVEVELFNRQSIINTYEVSDVDAECPKLESSEITDGKVILHLTDAGIGVDYKAITAVSADGKTHEPLSYDEQEGIVVFEYPKEAWDVYIPDHIGNSLHLAFTFK